MKKKNNIVKIVVAIILVVAVVGGILLVVNRAPEGVQSTIGEKVWLEAHQDLAVEDAGNKIVLKIDSDLDFDKTAESYSYEVPYVLEVNDIEYNGTHTFSKGYAIHSEDNDMPYQVGILDFETGKIQVIIKNK
ncbi:MAG: hypothetical protein J6A15_02360 [Clostridia bacterium]|nr:hypothetical protein [Clostridia bacterium]